MRTEHSPIFSNFQRQVFESTVKNPPSTKIGQFFSRVKLFFGAISAAFSLKNASLPSHIRMQEKTQRAEDIQSLFKAAMHPETCITSKELSCLKAETKAEEWFNAQLSATDYKTFKGLSVFLKDNRGSRGVVDRIAQEIETEGGFPLSKDEIKAIVYRGAEKVAREVYLMDDETLNAMRGTRETKKMNELEEMHQSFVTRTIPSFSCPANLLEQSELQQMQKLIPKHIAALEKTKKNPEGLAEKKRELEVINAILSDWDNRRDVEGQVTVASKKQHVANISEAKVEALEFARDELQVSLKNEKSPAKKKEIAANLREIKGILEAKKSYAGVMKAYQKNMHHALTKVSPQYVDLKALSAIPPNSDNKEIIVRAWSRVLERNLAISQKSTNPQVQIVSENKYLEAQQRLQILAQKKPGGELFQAILEKHGIAPVGVDGTEGKPPVSSTQNYLKLVDQQRAEALTKRGAAAQLSPQDVKNLRLLSKMLRWGRLENHDKMNQVSDKEKKDLEKFLFSALNNKNMNEKILAVSKNSIPLGIDEEAVEFIKSFTYKSKYHTQFVRITKKAENVADHLDRLSELPDNKKLSLRDYGVLKQAADLAGSFEGLEKAGLLREGSYLKLLGDYTTKAKDTIEEINEQTQLQMNDLGTYKSGDIAAWHSYKWQQFLVKKPTHEVELMRQWITDIGHGSFIYRSKPDEDGVSKTMQSHIYGTYENETLDSQQIAFSEIWRLDLSKLTDNSSPVYKLLEKVYASKGLDAKEEIQKMYEDVTREIHEDRKENLQDMENEEARRFAAGWADYGFRGGHKRKAPRSDNFSKVHDQFVNGPKTPGEKKWVICSEFVTKATIASLIETDKQLVQVIQDYLKENADDPIVKSMAEEILNANEKDGLHLIDLPYDKSERLKRVHPGRMVQLLHDKNCITKVDPPPVIKGIFTDETFNSGLKTKDLTMQQNTAERYIRGGNFKKGLAMLDKMAKAGAPESYYASTFAQFGLKPGDWSAIAKQKTNIKDPFFNSNIHFTQLEVDALRIIGKVDTDYSGKTKLTTEEKQTLMRFYAHIAQNEQFNKKIGEFARVQGKHDPQMKMFNSNAFRHMREFSFKTRQLDKLEEIAPRFNKVWEAVQNKKEDDLKDHEKITLHDYRMIDSFSNMDSFLSWAERRGLTENNFLGRMKSQVDSLDEGMKVINARFKEEVTYDTGDIILDVMEKAEFYDSKPFDPFNKVDWLLKVQKGLIGHKFQHAALAIKKEGNIEMAEMDVSYQKPIVEVGRLCIANVYRLDMGKMMTKRGLAHMRNREKNMGGTSIDAIDKKVALHVEDRFKTILAEVMNDEELFKELSNSAFRQVTTVLKATTKSTPNDLSQLGFESPQEIICTEFVARVYGHVIHRVNEEMQAEIKKNLMENKGLTKQHAETLSKKIQVLENPVQNANLPAIHGDRLYNLFEQYIHEVEPPDFIKKIQVSV
ncbi:hypothetical protein [Estrella lausannensis]|uniref:Uncharacterized protein n=1 Tax=Estrella lausannensis TaxID=483423 RepID=A0A0H5DN43_9BACT|nr:hypothetical protein [Estrella lausannensis]CRX37497.1 hypothetical protein ELAC_0135 [Estrella lausannensis]